MEPAKVEASDFGVVEHRCSICGTWLDTGQFCRACERRARNSQQFAESFWDEV
ncbi:MAG: hypothetical protein ACE5I7_15260 [Candidatus Binatia bacterium]